MKKTIITILPDRTRGFTSSESYPKMTSTDMYRLGERLLEMGFGEGDFNDEHRIQVLVEVGAIPYRERYEGRMIG